MKELDNGFWEQHSHGSEMVEWGRTFRGEWWHICLDWRICTHHCPSWCAETSSLL